MSDCKAEGCLRPQRDGSRYCTIHKPKPSDKYEDKDSVEYQRWREENPKLARKYEGDDDYGE